MEYNTDKLAKLAGISKRTLRYYDSVGLLKPNRNQENGYRVYGQRDVDLLQQILFYRELGVPLDQIGRLIYSGGYDAADALSLHLGALRERREKLDALILSVEKTIAYTKGEIFMSNEEKFEALKEKMIADNEEKYGAEAREKYGDSAMDSGNARIRGRTLIEHENAARLSERLNAKLKEAVLSGDPAGETAQEACALHKEWLMLYWVTYNKEAHLCLAQTYVDDPRFTQYYEAVAPDCARFLRDALTIFLK